MLKNLGNRIAGALGYVAAGTLVVVLTVETCAWITREPSDVERESRFIQYDPVLGWANRPGVSGPFASRRLGYSARVSFDERGWRSNGESTVVSPSKTLLVIGDSTTLGMEVDDDQTYPARLEQLFRSHGQGIRVINAGVRGYGTDQSALYLERLLKTVHPDMVLFMAGVYGLKPLTTIKNWYRIYGKPTFALKGDGLELLNSPVKPMEPDEYAFLRYHPDGYEIVHRIVKAPGIARWLREHSVLYAWLDDWYYRRFHGSDFRPPSDRPERIETFRRLLARMHRDWPGLVVTGFTMHDVNDVPDYDTYREVAAQEGIPFLDIRASFKPGVLYKFPLDGHWNQAGHARAATALYRLLAARPELRTESQGGVASNEAR